MSRFHRLWSGLATAASRGPAFKECSPTGSSCTAAWGRLGARGVLDAAERPVGREPLAHGAPERGVELRVARPYPGERMGLVVAVGQRVDVDAPDHLAARRLEHRVREPRPVAEV